MNDHLAKPIDPDKLFEALLRWITPRKAAKAVAVSNAVSLETPSAPPGHPNSLVIPGIDTETALKRTGGNRKRYESLLSRFAESQATTVEDIRVATSKKTP
jgi:hypothetical protein